MDSIQNYLQVMSDALEQKKTVLKQIYDITKRQEQYAGMEAFDEDAFAETLNAKEVLIAKVNQIDEGFTSVYERIRNDVIAQGGLYDGEIKKMQDQIRTCIEIGNEIQVIEERNKKSLAFAFSEKKKEYKTKATSNQVAKNYYRTMSNTKYMDAFFLDQKK